MEAALLGVPYEGRLPDFTSSRGDRGAREASAAAAAANPHLAEHRELRYDQVGACQCACAGGRVGATGARVSMRGVAWRATRGVDVLQGCAVRGMGETNWQADLPREG
jgi:hypothetical protein